MRHGPHLAALFTERELVRHADPSGQSDAGHGAPARSLWLRAVAAAGGLVWLFVPSAAAAVIAVAVFAGAWLATHPSVRRVAGVRSLRRHVARPSSAPTPIRSSA